MMRLLGARSYDAKTPAKGTNQENIKWDTMSGAGRRGVFALQQ